MVGLIFFMYFFSLMKDSSWKFRNFLSKADKLVSLFSFLGFEVEVFIFLIVEILLKKEDFIVGFVGRVGIFEGLEVYSGLVVFWFDCCLVWVNFWENGDFLWFNFVMVISCFNLNEERNYE